jgi:hypothetical protein
VLTIYCSGGVRKSTDQDTKLCWGDPERAALSDALGIAVHFVTPDAPMEDLSDLSALFGRDIYGVQIADVVVVDARQKRGLGVGIEMAAAKLYGKPLIAVVPRDSHYRQDDVQIRGGVINEYVHPHIRGLCDEVVGDFEAAGRWLADYLDRRPRVKGKDALDTAVSDYMERLHSSDAGMPPSVAA